jgi:hypothetical protein
MAIASWAGYPRSYSPGRTRPVQYAVIHYTAGSEGPTSAEAGVAYDKIRPDGTSCHCFADSDTVLREVPDIDRAHAARFHGNEIGLQLELCGTAQTRAQWLDPVSSATLRLGAKQVAEWCRDHGLPVRRLSVAETRAAYYAASGSRPKGIVGHVDVTNAYPEDGGTHTDPGAAFPWDVFLPMVAEELAALTHPKDDDMFKPEFFVLAQSPSDSGSACITGGGPTLGWRAIANWETVLVLAAEWGLNSDIKTWDRRTTALANDLYGKAPAEHTGGGLTYEEAVRAAEEGANRAEDN